MFERACVTPPIPARAELDPTTAGGIITAVTQTSEAASLLARILYSNVSASKRRDLWDAAHAQLSEALASADRVKNYLG